jgi:tetratricopeptide (TPR) repeat protein
MSDIQAKGGLAQSTALHLTLILLLGFLAYSNTFGVPFQFDDEGYIESNIFVTQPGEIFSPLSTASRLPESNVKVTVFTRYLGHLSFALNYILGGLEPTGYHAVNLAVHLINALLVYWLVVLTFRTPRMDGSRLGENSRLIALFSALLFVSHPVQTQAVTYLTQRFASLCAMFYLVSLTLYIKARLSERRKCRALYLLSFVSALMAMFTKEIAFTLPVAIALYEFTFFKGAIRKRLLYLVPLFLTLLIIPITMQAAGCETISGTRLATEMSRLDYLFTQFRVIVTYIRLLALPMNQSLVYDYPVFRAFLNPQVLSSFLLLISVFGLGLYLLRRSGTSEPALRFMAFGIFWFFIAVSVESSIIPIVDVIFEHRVYLPSAGAFMAVAAGAAIALDSLRSRKSRTAAAAALLAIPLCLAVGTYSRNALWQSDVTLWEDIVKKAPGSIRGTFNLGVAYDNSGQLEGAKQYYKATIRLKPDYVEVHNYLAIVYRKMGLPDQAIVHYLTSIKLRPDDARPHYNLGNIYREKGLLDEAEAQYRKAIELSPDLDEAYVNLGLVYKQKGRLSDAVPYYMQAIRLDPDNAPAHRNLGNAYLEQGLPDMAISEYRIALRLRPEDYAVHYTLALAYQKKGLGDKAAEHFRIAEDLKRKAESANK